METFSGDANQPISVLPPFLQGGESCGLNGRVHGISCRYSDKTCKKINYISTNTYSIIMQENAHTSSLFQATIHLSVLLQRVVVFRRSPSKIEILKTIFVRTCAEKYCILWGNFEMNVCFEYLGGICALFYENLLGIKKGVISSGYLFCPNIGTKFRELYHSNHVIPHRVLN